MSASTRQAQRIIRGILQDPVWSGAWHYFRRHLDRYVDHIVRVAEIPAPTFAEEPRARYVAERLRRLDILDVKRDETGNVIGIWLPGPPSAAGPVDGHPGGLRRAAPGGAASSALGGRTPTLQARAAPSFPDASAGDRPGAGTSPGTTGTQAGLSPESTAGTPPVVISAHLDTVFPPGTDLTVRRLGSRLYGPGIGDNSTSVACLLFLAEGLARARFRPRVPVVWLFNTGEEGLGNLRGIRHFLDRAPVRPAAMLVLDGGLGMICYRGLGSRRLRVTFSGPGGHSWKDFGTPSAIHAAGRAVARLAELPRRAHPRTTWNVGRIEGGTSVNTIAAHCILEIDLRSEAGTALNELEQVVRREVQSAAREEGVEVRIDVIGDRPQGALPPDHQLVALVRSAMDACGIPAYELTASTDANLPLSRGIPAVAFGIRHGDGAHTLHEFIERRGLDRGLRLALLALLATVRWAEQSTLPHGPR